MSESTAFDVLEQKLLSQPGDLSGLSAEQQFEILASKVASRPDAILPREDLLNRLRASKASGKPLRVKFGIDPTGPEIHVGHAVPLLTLSRLQRMGHQVVLVIGDFTGKIGDPSGATASRPPLTDEDIRRNMASYESQAARIVDLRGASVERHYNNAWMAPLTVGKWIEITKKIPVNSLLQREDFRNRLAHGHGMTMTELEYALFMGYDSVVLNPDIEIGGLDQYLNMHMCRQMMSNAGQVPEVIITCNILAGTTGERDAEGRFVKMSKSKVNYIAVADEPANVYGQVMSIPDDVMWIWFRELTEATPDEIRALHHGVESGTFHAKAVKQLLARALVARLNGFAREVVEAAERDFTSKFGKSAALVPEGVQSVTPGGEQTLVQLLSVTTKRSTSDVRRLAEQRGLRVLRGEEYVPVELADLSRKASDFTGDVLRVGKREYLRIAAEEGEDGRS